MSAEIWIVLLLLTAAAAAAAGFAWARRGAPKRSEVDALEAELASAREEAAAVQANVTTHFEQSAMLFGKLAQDYRAFLEHFSQSAQQLGLSEITARELLERADQPLLGQVDEVIDGDLDATPQAEAASAEPAGEIEPVATESVVPAPDEQPPKRTTHAPATAASASSAQPEPAVGAAGPDSPSSQPEPAVGAADSQSPSSQPEPAVGEAGPDSPSSQHEPAVGAAGPDSSSSQPEPPLIQDVVAPGKPAVVEVELDGAAKPMAEQAAAGSKRAS